MDFITGLIQLKEMLDVSWRSFVDELMCGSYVFLCCAVLLQMSEAYFTLPRVLAANVRGEYSRRILAASTRSH